MPSTQKALAVQELLGPFVVAEIPVPKPQAGELLIKVQATALNPVDWKIQKRTEVGQFTHLPHILGIDVAGDVEDIGEGVTNFKKGDRVLVQDRWAATGGGFQQYHITLAAVTAKIPANVSYDDAATIPLGFTTAYVGLYNKKPYGLGLAPPGSKEGNYAGTPFVILGGSSSVGQMAIQLVKLSGFSPIFTTASLSHTDSLKSLGATHVLDRNLEPASLANEIGKVIDVSHIKYIYDSVSLEVTQQQGLHILAPGGEMVVDLAPTLNNPDNKVLIRALAVSTLPQNLEIIEEIYQNRISKYLENGSIKPNRVEVLPNGLAGIPDGLARMEADQVSRLKLVAHPQETA
ncbi:hypothetical protein GALMADRAFT_231255 [Galerina marginata CBS 339.88]|uniref:Enoyl reductase (ER) domain-containing protein n=1 Tax=Galerina marginata (strain CBS 339.88) TaxID=685588 RepID=A0A067SF19_GALM3|nr:hypothetical protein GALMADRAFT_231255 [Galerina marginata CBS 339.88]